MPVLAGGDLKFRDDDGSADPRAAAALAAFASGQGSEQAALATLAGSRLLVPVVAAVSEPKGLKAPGRRAVDTARNAPAPGRSTQGGEKGSEMSLPTLVGRDGTRAIPAFTCLDALPRCRPHAPPPPGLAAGESHGRALVAICEGMPAGVQITTADVAAALARRRSGYGRGARMKFEQDEAEITGGVRHGVTLGGPVAIRVANTEWPKWETVMSADPVAASQLADQARNAPLTRPRPGHADLAGMQKYGYDDARPVLERASARGTAARVALGEVGRRFLRQAFGIQIVSHVISIGSVCAPEGVIPRPEDGARVDEDPVRCLDPAASAAMQEEIDRVRKDGDTLGGVIEVAVYGAPPGLGSPGHWDRRPHGRLAGALMSIHAIKGVEIGDGFATARRRGSGAPDAIEGRGGGT